MSEAKIREEFEAWATEHSTMAQYLDRTVSGLYASSVTESFWNCWKASRASVVVVLPKKLDLTGFGDYLYDDLEVIAAIEATGLKVEQ